MTKRNDTEKELRTYIRALPTGRPPPRDRSTGPERVLAALHTRAQLEERRAHVRRWLRVAGVVVSGSAVLFIGLWPERPVPTEGPTPAALTVLDGALLLESGGVLRTLHAGDSIPLDGVGSFAAPSDLAVRIRLSDVVAVTLTPSSRARPIGAGAGPAGAEPMELQAIALERGRVHLDVKTLAGARRFHVVTPDADVEVRGTAFDVALRPGPVPCTTVSVQAGLVLVAGGLKSRLLRAGESGGCDDIPSGPMSTSPKVDKPPAPDLAANVAPNRPLPSPGRRGAARTRASDPPQASDLRAQNQLFRTALAAERGARFEAAARLYRELLARAPEGPLAVQARANLAAVLSARP
jgi:hypothetical protein